MKIEHEKKRLFLKAWDGFHSNVEPSLGSSFGHPDTLLARDDLVALVEFKRMNFDGGFSLKRTQSNWHREFNKHSGIAWWCILGSDRYYLLRSPLVIESIGKSLACHLLDGAVRPVAGPIPQGTRSRKYEGLEGWMIADDLRSGSD